MEHAMYLSILPFYANYTNLFPCLKDSQAEVVTAFGSCSSDDASHSLIASNIAKG